MENIVFGKPYTVETGVPIANSFGTMGNEHPLGLTDENTPSLDYADKGWSKFYRGLDRRITIDLGGEYAVNGFEITFLQNRSAGIYSPDYVELQVSENGSDFMIAYTVDGVVPACESEVKTSVFRITDAVRYKAKYIRLVFNTEVNVFACRFKVFGGECNGSELPIVSVLHEKPHVGMREREDGFSSTVIIYHGYWDNTMNYDEHYVKNTVKSLLPYVGYLTKSGELVDTMFDSVVFLLLQSRSPSGGKTIYFNSNDSSNALIKSDFDAFTSNLYEKGYNMDALNTAFGIVKKQLGLPADRRLSVSIQIPYVYKTTRPFGDIDGDGNDEPADTFEQRLAIYNYYIDKIIADFNGQGYENLSLTAFYQGCESVPVGMSEEEFKLFRAVNDSIHAHGYRSTWIPCFLGTGFDKWRELGFDFAYLQPNYMFHDWKAECLADFAEIIDKYGLGAEIEINHTCVAADHERFERDRQKYVDYLDYGARYGYMNAATAYYQGAGPGSFYNAAVSGNAEAREVYDMTYRFIKGKYIPETDEEENAMSDNLENVEDTAEETAEAVEEVVETTDEAVEKAAEQLKAKVKVKAEAVKVKAAAAASKAASQAKVLAEKVKAKSAAKAQAAENNYSEEEIPDEEANVINITGDKIPDVKIKVRKISEDKALAAASVIGAVIAVISAVSGGNKKSDK